jgi:twitching motility protein PilI
MTSTMSGSENSLRSLRDRPFELLKELEKRSRTVAAGAAPDAAAGREWVGVAFRMGGETFLVAREETREVLGYPATITRIPGAKSWVKGLANVRGQLLPMLDLRQFLGSGATTPQRNTRVVVANHREVPAGLIVDEVLGFRRFAESEFNVVVLAFTCIFTGFFHHLRRHVHAYNPSLSPHLICRQEAVEPRPAPQIQYCLAFF